MTTLAQQRKNADVAEQVDRRTLKRLRELMRRDGIAWTEFVRRAVLAYDLMYSRDE